MDEKSNIPYCSFCGKKVKSESELTLLDGRPCCTDCLPRVKNMKTDFGKKANKLLEEDGQFARLARRLEGYNHRRKSSGYLLLLCLVVFFAGLEINFIDFLLVPAMLVFIGAAVVFIVSLILELIAKGRLKNRLTEPEDSHGPEF